MRVIPTGSRAGVLLAALIVLLASGVAGFLITRTSSDETETQAEAVATREPFWYVPILEAEARKPRGIRTINGITIGSVETAYDSRGCSGTAENLPLSVANGTPLRLSPKYLPTGAVMEEDARAVSCGGEIVLTAATFSIRSDRAADRFGGWITITRVYLSAPRVGVDLPVEHFSAGNIGGRRAVFVKPPTVEGFGESAIVVSEEFGATVIWASGLTLGELIRVAEGLY